PVEQGGRRHRLVPARRRHGRAIRPRRLRLETLPDERRRADRVRLSPHPARRHQAGQRRQVRGRPPLRAGDLPGPPARSRAGPPEAVGEDRYQSGAEMSIRTTDGTDDTDRSDIPCQPCAPWSAVIDPPLARLTAPAYHRAQSDRLPLTPRLSMKLHPVVALGI